MTEYLNYTFDWSQQDAAATFDEQPLWTAMAGLLLLEHVPLRAGARLLDVGTGTGFPLLELAQRLGSTATAVGLDPWSAALNRAVLKQRVWRVPNAHLIRGDAVAMPFPAATFDLVVSNLGLNNFEDAPAAIAECARVLRPEGRLAITTNLEGHMKEFYDLYAAVLDDIDLPEAAAALQRHVEHRATVMGLRTLFANASLTVTTVEQRELPMRFADGTALLNHSFIKRAFLPDWKAVVPEPARRGVFAALESALNARAATEGELRLTIPLAYIEAAIN